MSLEVHIDWAGETLLAGHLFSAERGGAVSFQYAREWLLRPDRFALDPTSLPLHPDMQHSANLFGGIQDCGPDRWGKRLIERAVRRKVLAQKPFREVDYVLALDDHSRIGALRFRSGPEEPFLSPSVGVVPPLVRLAALLRAAEAIHLERETAEDLRFLLGEGSPLGGARPKSAVRRDDGGLAIAKFPKLDDTRDIGAGETLALQLARNAGIRTAESQRVAIRSSSVTVIARFDREGGQRIPFLSAASLLGLESSSPGSYTLMADAIRRFGDAVTEDLIELWRRMVFSLLASNCDDHLRNHGFLMRKPGRWSLSPAYDLNPVPEIERTQMNQTPVSEEHGESGISVALEVASRFGLKPPVARKILGEVFAAVRGWRDTGKTLRLKAGTLNAYASAFENPLMEEAARLLTG